MENYDFCEELKGGYNSEIFTAPTIYALLNGFIKATSMNLEEGSTRFNDITYTKEKENEYYVDVDYYSNIRNKDKYICFRGHYQDFSFNLQGYFNYYYIFSKNILEIPLDLELEKIVENNQYVLSLTGKNGETRVNIIRKNMNNELDYEDFSFYIRRMDIENILCLVSAFLNSPKYVLEKYQSIYLAKKVYFSNSEMDEIKYDSELKVDEKGVLLQKVLK